MCRLDHLPHLGSGSCRRDDKTAQLAQLYTERGVNASFNIPKTSLSLSLSRFNHSAVPSSSFIDTLSLIKRKKEDLTSFDDIKEVKETTKRNQ